MDLVLLVVAADDSINQQTREHLEILRLLDLKAGVIALSKCDLADPAWLELVEGEIRQLVARTFLADAPIVRTSTLTLAGLDVLREELLRAALKVASSRPALGNEPFRLAIDRTFTIAGQGTVVTGTVSSGQARVGDELVIEPGGIPVRVRGLHNHDRPVQEIHRSQRAAVNLVGVHHGAIRRGQELAEPGHLLPGKLLTVQLTMLEDAPPLRSRSRLRVHAGTAEIMASVSLLDRAELAPGEAAPVQLFLAEPAVTTWNQPLVVRRLSPVRTVGGGRVLQPNAQRLHRPDANTLAQLAALNDRDPFTRAAASLFLAGWGDWQPAHLPRLAGMPADEGICAALAQRGELIQIPVSAARVRWIHRRTIEHLGEQVAQVLHGWHGKQPLKLAFSRPALSASFAWLGEPALLDAALKWLETAGRIRCTAAGIALVGQGPKLTRGEQALLDQLIDWFLTAGLNAPSPAECRQRAAKNQASLAQLLELAVGSGQLIHISSEYYLHSAAEQTARQHVSAAFATRTKLTLSEIRELLGTTRKYAVPLCEYWDRTGFTQRSGDVRWLKSPCSAE
jgi:selenocysteine-specific elongation factor